MKADKDLSAGNTASTPSQTLDRVEPGSSDPEVTANLVGREQTSVASASSAFSMQLANAAGRSHVDKRTLADTVHATGFAAWDPARIDGPQLQQILALLEQADSVLLVGHVGPDGDCVGSALSLARALRALGKSQVDVCVDAVLPGQLAKLDTEHQIRRADELAATRGDKGWDLVLILDGSEPGRLGQAAPLLLPHARAVAVADHHQAEPTREAFSVADGVPFVAWVEPAFPAASLQTAALLARLDDKLQARGVDLEQVYLPALVGFATDTGFGRYPSTDRASFHYFKHMLLESAHTTLARVQQAIAFELSPGLQARLLGQPDGGVIPAPIATQLDMLQAAGLGLTETRHAGPDGGKPLAIVSCDERYLELLSEAAHDPSNPHPDDQLSTVADLVGFLKGPRLNALRADTCDPSTGQVVEPGYDLVALLIQKQDGTVGCELRSRDGSALTLAELLGGGGHAHAAGATRTGTLDSVRAAILAWAAPRLATEPPA